MSVLVLHDDGSDSVRRLAALLRDRLPEVEIRTVPTANEARAASTQSGVEAVLLPPGPAVDRPTAQAERDERRLLAVGRLAGGVAHDFNNALTGIMGYAALAEEELPGDDPVRGMLAQIIRGAERAASLARHLLTFARRQPLLPQEVDLNAVIGDVDRMLRRVLRENVELALVRDPELGPCLLDPTRLEQVIVHLVVDAGDALPQGGRVCVETSNVPETSNAPARIRLTVRGEGTEATPGTDEMLGDTIAREIVERSGGTLTASTVDGGPSFRVEFPRREEQTPENAGAPRITPGTETILLVDDEELVLHMAGQVLESAGYRVLSAPGVESALDLARNHDGPIHLLLTDVVMPVMNGPRLARKLRAERPDLRVLYISGYAADVLAREGGLDDSDVLLAKPFVPSRLTRVLREMFDTEV